MKPSTADTPDLSDAGAKALTSRSLPEWFAHLDAEGGIERGRWDLVTHLYSAQKLDAWLGPKSKVDFRDGGGFTNADGDRGTFLREREGKDLRFSWDHATRATGSLVDVLFADKGKGKTGVTLNHTRIQSRGDADELRAGWAAAFDALKLVVERA